MTELPPPPPPDSSGTDPIPPVPPEPVPVPFEARFHPGIEFVRRMGRNAGEIWDEHRLLIVSVGLVVAFFVLFFWKSIFIKIGPGDAGVIYRLFNGGTDTKTVYAEGLHIVFPWNTMYIYNARVQQVADSFTVLSQDGLAIKVEVSTRFRPQYAELGLLHKNLGPDYIEKVVVPDVQAEFRFVMGQYRPEEIYQSQGFIVQTAVQGALATLADRYILLDDLLLKSVTLPPTVAASIESKLRAEQLAMEFDYRLQTETKEAERKRIEAKGIRDFQDIVTAEGISQDYLRFKGIEATLELAKSPNSKIVIIGGGDDRLPLILDTATQPLPLSPEARSPAPASGNPRPSPHSSSKP